MELLKYLLIILLAFAILWSFSRLIKTVLFRHYIKSTYAFLFFLLILEGTLIITYRLDRGSWIFLLHKHPNSTLFENHPYMSVSNRKEIKENLYGVHICHNRYGQRSKDYDINEINSATRIITIGGSTTYGVGVNDWETWPNILDSLTGDDTILINLAVPGHTTVEHLITAALYLQDFNPDVIIIHAGLNDMRVSHVKDLMNDYSNFHEPDLKGSMGLCHLEQVPKIATLYYLVQIMQKAGIYPVCSFHSTSFSGEVSPEIDQNAINIYKRNLMKLIYLCKYHTDRILLIPQVLIDEKIKNNDLQWWIPFIPSDKLLPVLKRYNSISKEVADSANSLYLDEVDEFAWNSDDFSDASHLNSTGNMKLAKIIHRNLVLFDQLNEAEK